MGWFEDQGIQIDPAWSVNAAGAVSTGAPVARTTGSYAGDNVMTPDAAPAPNQPVAPSVYGEIPGFVLDKIRSGGNAAYTPGGKYSPAVQNFSAFLGSGGSIGQNQLDQAVAYARANGFPNATSSGTDKIDYGDGNGPIDVVKSDGTPWFQNGPDRFGGPQANGMPGVGGVGSGGAFGSPGGAPTPTPLTYNPAQAPTPQTYQTIGNPQALSYQSLQQPQAFNPSQQLAYNPMATPTAFRGDRQSTAPTLGQFQDLPAFVGDRQTAPTPYQYNPLATPTEFKGITEADLYADPSYKFRRDQELEAVQNSGIARGILQTGGFAKALGDYAGQSASQEYANVYGRKLGESQKVFGENYQTNQANNQGQLGAYTTNTGIQLGVNSENYNRAATEAQRARDNALSAFQTNTGVGQQNFTNQFNVNDANYGRAATEAQQGFTNAFGVNQANNAGSNAAIQGNTTNALSAAGLNSQNALAFGNANNANALNFGNANFANQLAATQANNANNLAFGGQNFNQNFAVNQANNQGQFNAGQANNANALAAYNASVAASQGQQGLNNQYTLGLGNLDLARSGQLFNQGLQTYNTNYLTQVQDPFTRNLQLAQLGNPGQNNAYNANMAGLTTNTLEGQGNVNAAGNVAANQAYLNALNNLGQYAQLGAGRYPQPNPLPPYGVRY